MCWEVIFQAAAAAPPGYYTLRRLELVQTMVEVIGRQGVVFSGEYFLDNLRSFTSPNATFLSPQLPLLQQFLYIQPRASLWLSLWPGMGLMVPGRAFLCHLLLTPAWHLLHGVARRRLAASVRRNTHLCLLLFLSLSLLLKIIYFCFMSMSICLHVCLCTMCVHCTQKRASDQL